MKELNSASQQESLEQLPTPQLDAILRAELEKETPDEHTVRLVLKVLRNREAGYPVEINEQVNAAWKEYEKKTAPGGSGNKEPLMKAAVTLIACGFLLAALPQQANAWGIFDRITGWTDSFFELFSPGERSSRKMYEFRTDHPGLQELYDTVTELGVTIPVVPMWIEAGYVLVDCKVIETPATTRVIASFSNEGRELIFELNIYSQNKLSEYHKDESNAEKYESSSVIHNVFRNEDLWTAVWVRENVECSMAIDCPEDTVYQILDSIYTMEE